MKLILTGGGSGIYCQQVQKALRQELKKAQKDKILYVPFSCPRSSWTENFKDFKKAMEDIKLEAILLKSFDKTTIKDLSSYGAIYFEGGNTFKLMAQIRKSNFFTPLRQFIVQGGLLIGDSAGAIIMGSHLETAHFGNLADENKKYHSCYQGLNLIGLNAIHCHYHHTDHKEISHFLKATGLPVLALYEETAIFIHKNKVKILDSHKAVLFEQSIWKKKVLMPGSSYQF